jgi:hypothetical protein
MNITMSKLIVFLTAALVLAGCNKSPNAPSGTSNPSDPVERKLADLAGPGAKSCGHLKTQTAAEVDAAGKCVMQSATDKKPFYVAYDLPGLTVAIAGNADGKLFSMQTNPSATGGLAVTPCPAELRIAPSGRATCYAPGTFPMGTDSSMHEPLMTMPPNGASPHQRLGAPPPGTPNPHTQPKAPGKTQ